MNPEFDEGFQLVSAPKSTQPKSDAHRTINDQNGHIQLCTYTVGEERPVVENMEKKSAGITTDQVCVMGQELTNLCIMMPSGNVPEKYILGGTQNNTETNITKDGDLGQESHEYFEDDEKCEVNERSQSRTSESPFIIPEDDIVRYYISHIEKSIEDLDGKKEKASKHSQFCITQRMINEKIYLLHAIVGKLPIKSGYDLVVYVCELLKGVILPKIEQTIWFVVSIARGYVNKFIGNKHPTYDRLHGEIDSYVTYLVSTILFPKKETICCAVL